MHTARRSQPSSTRLLLVVVDSRSRGNGPAGITSEGGLQVSAIRTRYRSNALGLMHYEECAFLYAHASFSADQLVVESQGVSGLQAGVFQRILHTFQGDAGGRT